MADRSPQEEVNASLVRVLGEMSGTLSNINTALRNQTDAIQATPDKKYVNVLSLALLVLIVLGGGIQAKFIYDQQVQTRSIGETNDRTVAIYCQAQRELTECTNTGSSTAKAGAILASCRIYENLSAATPPGRRVAVKTDAACKALGFTPQP